MTLSKPSLRGRARPGPAGTSSVRRPPVAAAVTLALVLLVVALAVSVSVGPLRLDLGTIARAVGGRLGLADDSGLSRRDVSVVWQLRIPRAGLGAMVGASLAIAGAALQSLFANPLADPGVIGVSGGASTGAIAAIVLGGAGTGTWLVPLGAFTSGLAVTALIYVLARPARGGATPRMLLVGIAVGSGCQALTGFLTFVADDAELQSLTFWQLGSLGKVTGVQALSVVPVFVLGLVVLLCCARRLDVLTLGARQAEYLGIDVRATRAVITVAAALLVAAAVSFAGAIGFVGLVVPHIVRQLVGPAHRALLPLSALTGAVLVVAADCAARTLAPPLEIPIGLFTAAVGAPFFLALVLRTRRQEW